MQLAFAVEKTRAGSLDVLNSVANELAKQQLHATIERLAPHLDYVQMKACDETLNSLDTSMHNELSTNPF